MATELAYYILYKPKNGRDARMKSIVPTKGVRNPDTGAVTITDQGERDHTRNIWNSMIAEANRSGTMRHPETREVIQLAQLRHGGVLDDAGAGHGGAICQSWSETEGFRRHFEPDLLQETPADPSPAENPAQGTIANELGEGEESEPDDAPIDHGSPDAGANQSDPGDEHTENVETEPEPEVVDAADPEPPTDDVAEDTAEESSAE